MEQFNNLFCATFVRPNCSRAKIAEREAAQKNGCKNAYLQFFIPKKKARSKMLSGPFVI